MENNELMRGTLDALVLKTLSWGPRHGFGIAVWIRRQSGDSLAIEDRALYLALHRLQARGCVESEWGITENNRRARYYSLTSEGRAELALQISRLSSYTAAMFAVLDAAEWESA